MPGLRTVRRFPLEPLAAVFGIELGRPGGDRRSEIAPDNPDGVPALHALIAAAGIDRTQRTIENWRRYGIPGCETDDLACLVAHRHPSELWPDWFD